jgi:hypothetical protein
MQYLPIVNIKIIRLVRLVNMKYWIYICVSSGAQIRNYRGQQQAEPIDNQELSSICPTSLFIYKISMF